MSGPSAEERMATAERLLGLEVLAREAAERVSEERRQHLVKALQREVEIERERDEARAEAGRLRGALAGLCRGHPDRGSYGPCDCIGCRALEPRDG